MALTLSVLDLSPVGTGSTSAQALRNTLDLARRAEGMGYARYWLAEHHNMPGIAGSSPAVLIGQVARETSRIRVGSGGVMLPNHAPLQVAEAFQTLEALFPGRIDLGLGRAPGTDMRTALALRGAHGASGEDFPAQLSDLMAFSSGEHSVGDPFRSVAAMPGGVSLPPVWLLGSSDFGARLAAREGLGFAFAHHINPVGAELALHLYQTGFKPSAQLAAPRALLTVSVVCAETDAQADALASSFDLAFLRLLAGRPGLFPSPEEARAYPYTPEERAQVRATRTRLIVGSPQTVRDQVCRLVGATGVGEVMVTTMVHDHAARVRSYELLAEALGVGSESLLPQRGGV